MARVAETCRSSKRAPPPDTRVLSLTGLQDEVESGIGADRDVVAVGHAGPVRSRSVLPSGHGRAASRAGGELGAAGRNLGAGPHGGRLGNGIDRPAVCGDLAMTGEIMSSAELAVRLGRELSAPAVDGDGWTDLRYAAALD